MGRINKVPPPDEVTKINTRVLLFAEVADMKLYQVRDYYRVLTLDTAGKET